MLCRCVTPARLPAHSCLSSCWVFICPPFQCWFCSEFWPYLSDLHNRSFISYLVWIWSKSWFLGHCFWVPDPVLALGCLTDTSNTSCTCYMIDSQQISEQINECLEYRKLMVLNFYCVCVYLIRCWKNAYSELVLQGHYLSSFFRCCFTRSWYFCFKKGEEKEVSVCFCCCVLIAIVEIMGGGFSEWNMLSGFNFFFNKFIYFMYLFLAALGLRCCVRAFSSCGDGGYSSLWCVGFSLWCAGFSLRWLLLLQSMGSRRVGFSSCGTRAQ